jgi:hypothetical protein
MNTKKDIKGQSKKALALLVVVAFATVAFAGCMTAGNGTDADIAATANWGGGR